MFFKRRKSQKSVENSSKSNTQAKQKSITGRLQSLFKRHPAAEEEFFEELEDLLVEADFGSSAAVEIVDELREVHRREKMEWDRDHCITELSRLLLPHLRGIDLNPAPKTLSLYMILGVNGVGKTTTIAKMAHRYIKAGMGPVTLAAGDTFRAAAIDQLSIHADRVGARLVRQEYGSDPGAVIYDALNSARSRGDRVVLADTAGRMHNRTNLINELKKIDRIAQDRLGSDAVFKKILVIDATTGQNGLKQTETFHEAVGVDAIVLAKYDSSAKGGLLAAIGRQFSLPFAYLGRGEKMDDLEPFNSENYLAELFF